MRSSNTRLSKEISLKKVEVVDKAYLDVNTILQDIIPAKDSKTELISKLSPRSLHSYLNKRQHATDAARVLPEMPCELDVVHRSSFATARNRFRDIWL
jgi:hypothetical protein